MQSESRVKRTVKNKFLFSNTQKKKPAGLFLKTLIKKCCDAVTEKFDIEYPCEISITFVDNEQIREINRETRDIDRATDVLSFPMNEMKDGEFLCEPDTDDRGRLILGDIVISLEKAQAQAQEYGHSYKREVSFLCVHSMLHLIGFDHMVEEEEKQMFALQEEILESLGITRK